jgi:hypothetical protein
MHIDFFQVFFISLYLLYMFRVLFAPIIRSAGVLRNFLRWRGYARNFFSVGGVQKIQSRAEGREKGDMGALTP